MKLKILIILTFLMTFLNTDITLSETVSFDTPITMKVNDKYIKSDSEPYLYKGLTYVPARFASEALGADNVIWNEDTRTCLIYDSNTEISLTIGKNAALVNGKKVKTSGSVMLVNSRTYVPVRFVAETLGASVDWDKGTYTVNITKEGTIVPSNLVGSLPYSDDDIYWLSRIVNSESGGEPMKGKIAVANTVLNRVHSDNFPDTIYGVIFDKKYGVQYQPTMNGTIYQTPLGDSIIAAKRALSGENVVAQSMYFLNPDRATNFWIPQNRVFYTTIGNHDFYL